MQGTAPIPRASKLLPRLLPPLPPPPPKERPPSPRARRSVSRLPSMPRANDDFQTVGRGGRTETFTSEGLFKSLAAIMEARGKKSTDKGEQIRKLHDLSGVADTPYKKVRVLLALAAARFDYNASANAYMPVEMWDSARKEINELIALLTKNRSYIVREETEDYDDEVERVPNQNGEKDTVAVRGSIISFVDRLDDEFTKSLQNIDPHTTEYVDRLSDEKKLYETIVLAQGYFEGQANAEALSRCTMRRLDHVYAKQDVIIKALESTLGETAKSFQSKLFPSAARVAEQDGPAVLVRALCTYLYQARGVQAERPRTRAILCHIYFHALHADYHVARDMFLMSHLQDAIQLADVATQILYNRVVFRSVSVPSATVSSRSRKWRSRRSLLPAASRSCMPRVYRSRTIQHHHTGAGEA